MNYKMIVLDIDDTLLTPDHTISPKTKEALIEVQKKGVQVVLCSGRPTVGMIPIAKELEVDKYGGYVISYNGANIVEIETNNIIYENSLSVEQIHRLYDLSKSAGIGIHTYSDVHILAEKEYKQTKFESDLVGMPIKIIENFKEVVNKPVVKAIMVDEPSVLKSIEDKVFPHTKDLSVTYSKPFFLEFMNNAVNKGLSLKYLCEKLGVKQSEVIAFGDSHNDLAMLEYAGMGVAMGNAVNEVKEMANFVTKTNTEDGIAYTLEKFM